MKINGAAGRFAAVITFLIAFAAGCNNFSLLSEFTVGQNGTQVSALTLTPTNPAVRVGSTLNFSAAGGSGPYSYSVQSGGAGGTIYPLSGVYTAPNSVGSGTDTVVVNDAVGATSVATVTIVAASQLIISPLAVTIAVNRSYQFSAIGGVPPYTYRLYPSAVPVPSGLYQAPSTATTTTVRVTDGVGSISDATVTVVAGGPLAISPTTLRFPKTAQLHSRVRAGNRDTHLP